VQETFEKQTKTNQKHRRTITTHFRVGNKITCGCDVAISVCLSDLLFCVIFPRDLTRFVDVAESLVFVDVAESLPLVFVDVAECLVCVWRSVLALEVSLDGAYRDCGVTDADDSTDGWGVGGSDADQHDLLNPPKADPLAEHEYQRRFCPPTETVAGALMVDLVGRVVDLHNVRMVMVDVVNDDHQHCPSRTNPTLCLVHPRKVHVVSNFVLYLLPL
jgi:hypothetical protein